MPRYCKQRDQYRCGPIAILNALKWAGKKVTYKKHIERLTRECKCKAPKGTWWFDITRVLRKYGFSIYKRRVLSAKEIKKHLSNGGAIIVNAYWDRKKNQRHFFLLLSNEGKDWCKAVNLFSLDEKAPYALTREERDKYLRRQIKGAGGFWLLRKK